ncbi:Diacylglycerol kinase gamma [Frankliniella fusca]|uniref:Diacylglycerol kinase gamma n=1 Tax=Frankliniella fusca TaxID=407009 RepID=A0AAE1LQV5_9NEOP|nr:Diacylglycerol kinase gamma [Frankliniella fusca]
MVMALQKPDRDWPSYSCRVRHTYEKYNKARAAANKQNDQVDTVVTEPSDLDGRKRKREKNKKYESSSSDESVKVKKRRTKTAALEDVSDEGDDSDEENAKLQETIEQLLKGKASTASGKKSTQSLLKISEGKTSKPSEKANNTDGSNRNPSKKIKTTSVFEVLHKSHPGKARNISTDISSSENLSLNCNAASSSKTVITTNAISEKVLESYLAKEANCSQKSDKITLGNVSATSSVQNTSLIQIDLDHEDEGFMEAINNSTNKLSSDNIGFNKNASRSSETVNSNFENYHEPHPGNQGDSLQNSEESISVVSRTTSPLPNALGVEDLTYTHENDEGCFIEDESSKGPDPSGSKNLQNTKVISRVKMNMLSELSSKVDVVLLNQARLFALLAPEEDFVERPPNLPHTPLKNLDAYHEFEEFLSEPVNADALVSHLKISVMNLSSEKEATAAMLKSIITNNLSRALSWGGGAGKEKFKQSKIMNVMSRVILKLFPKSKLEEAKGKVKRWLETSNQRKPEDEDSNSD